MKPINQTKLILASESPRRKQLLEQAGVDFTIVPADINENVHLELEPSEHVTKLSELKAIHVAEKYPEKWVLAADTIVAANGKMLGKPQNRAKALLMLSELSNYTHQVYTGFCITNLEKKIHYSSVVKTDVTFKALTKNEIDWYLDTPEPYDKAGSYAIQGTGSFFVRKIDGSFTNVVGLPVCEVVEVLKKYNIINYGQNDEKQN
jgi:septum formation protein